MISTLVALAITFTAQPALDRYEDLAWQDADARAEQMHERDVKSDIAVGAKYAVEVETHCKMCTDPQIISRVQRIGAIMADIANQTHSIALWGDHRFNQFNYSFKVIEDKIPNAFSLPGGYIYVQTGLLKLIESDDELAGVLAHEISHAKFRHVAQLQRDANKMQMVQLPLLLAAILSGSAAAGAVIEGSQMAGTALQNGWSVKAEEAADYGGIQLMVKSQYNPTAMLTLMEHLELLELSEPQYYSDLGIFRTHPPSKERADSMTKYLRQYGIPIQRSKVSTSFRAVVNPDDKIPNAVDVAFAGQTLFTFAGDDALTRADAATAKLNDFLDSVPQMYEVTAGKNADVLGRSEPLVRFTPADADAEGKSVEDLQKDAVAGLRNAIYTVSFRIWSSE